MDPTKPPSGKSKMALAMEALREKRKKKAAENASSSSSATRASFSFVQSEPNGILAMTLQNQRSQLLPTKSVSMEFFFASHVVFNIPTQSGIVQRDYVAHNFTYGTVFSPGVEIYTNWRSSDLTKVEVQFLHTDAQRKSYNLAQFIGYGTTLTILKPASALSTFQQIMSNEMFFVQESALTKIIKFYDAEYSGQLPNVQFLSYAKIIGGPKPISELKKISKTDGNLILSKVMATREELSEIEVIEDIPVLISLEKNYIKNEERYFPLTQEQQLSVGHCENCNVTFQHVLELYHHYEKMSPRCKKIDLPKQLQEKFTFKSILCIPCSQISANVWSYCVHRDGHRHKNEFFCCIFCTQIFWSAQSFVGHTCTTAFLDMEIKPPSDTDQFQAKVDSNYGIAEFNCVFCSEKSFNYMTSFLCHLIESSACFKKMLTRSKLTASKQLTRQLKAGNLNFQPLICSLFHRLL